MAPIPNFNDLEVVFEDNHLLAVNKPFGVLSQGDSTGDADITDYAREYLRNKYQKLGNVFVGLPHRIDRPVGGLLLLCKTSKALERITEQWRNSSVEKIYYALCINRPSIEQDTITHYLLKNEQTNTVKAFLKPTGTAKQSSLTYKLLSINNNLCLIQITPHTGRPHQIRVQLSAMGCPIAGDLKYGATSPLPDGNIALFAQAIRFNHPTQKTPMRLELPLPTSGIWKAFKV